MSCKPPVLDQSPMSWPRFEGADLRGKREKPKKEGSKTPNYTLIYTRYHSVCHCFGGEEVSRGVYCIKYQRTASIKASIINIQPPIRAVFISHPTGIRF